MSSAQQLLVVGLSGEHLLVPWQAQDSAGDIKCRAFAAASDVRLADGSRQSLVSGVAAAQLCLVYGLPGDAVKLDDASLISDCMPGLLRSAA